MPRSRFYFLASALLLFACGSDTVDDAGAGGSAPEIEEGKPPLKAASGGHGGRSPDTSESAGASGVPDEIAAGAAGESNDFGEFDKLANLTGCDLAAPFDPPVPVFTGTTIADGITFSQDGLTAYVSSKATGAATYDIYIATRALITDNFSPLTKVEILSSTAHDRAPSLSADGLRLYLAKFGAGSYDLALATRTASNVAFTAPQMLSPFNAYSYHDQDPFVLAAPTPQLYFASENPSFGYSDQKRHLFVASVLTNGYSPPVALSVNTVGEDDSRPVLSSDGNTLYFSSTRTGIGSDSDGDIWLAKRSASNLQFGQPTVGAVTNLYGLNTSKTEFPVALSSNACTLYFASNRDTGNVSDFRLYQATRGPTVPATVTTTLKIVGAGSVTTPAYQCSSTCTFQGTPEATAMVTATGQAIWSGSCTSNGGNPSGDGVFVYTNGGTCTVTFPTGSPGGPGTGCEVAAGCQSGLECTNGTCQCAPNAPCSALCPCGPGAECTADNECDEELACVNDTCAPPECALNPVHFGCGFPNAPCGPCTRAGLCSSNTDCPSGYVCPEENGWRYMQPGERVCELAGCSTGREALGCGLATSTCGLCDRCIPSCEGKQCGDLDRDDGCGGICTGLCSVAAAEGCETNLDCTAGSLCMPVELDCTSSTCARTCRPADPCGKPGLAAPFCGSPTSICGPTCPMPVQGDGFCVDREHGVDPVDGVPCGSCGTNEFPTQGGLCAPLASDPPILVPDDQGQARPILPEPSPAAVPVGTIPGQFAVTDRGSASYVIPIEIPPGRAGIEPTLSLRYTSSTANGALGLGWSLDGLSIIASCNKSYALDNQSSASTELEPRADDAFCLDGQRLIPISAGADEFRTAVDTFSKVVATPGGDASTYDFKVYTKDGRILTYGGYPGSALVKGSATGGFSIYALSKVADRSGNSMRIVYDQIPARHEDTGRTAELLPRAITYTGHGNEDGDREVSFKYEERSDFALGWRAGGLATQRTKRLSGVEVRAKGQLVRRYDLGYEIAGNQSRLISVQEAVTDLACSASGAICKPPTKFTYFDEIGFQPGIEVDSPRTFGHPLAGITRQATPFGIVHKWSPESEWNTRSPQLGLLRAEERRADRITSLAGSSSVTSTSPIPGEAGLGLSIGSIVFSSPYLTAGATLVSLINFFGSDEEVRISYKSYAYSPLFRDDPFTIPDFTGETIPKRKLVIGPTGGETVRNISRSSVQWLVDVDGDGVQDKIFCNSSTHQLDYKLSTANAAPANMHPAVPAGEEISGSIAPIFPNICMCFNLFGDYCREPPSMVIDVDGDGTGNLIFSDDGDRWAALDFSSGTPQWRTDWLQRLEGVVSPATHYIAPADINGDGLRDLVAFAGKSADFSFATGLVDTTRSSYLALNTGVGFDVRLLTADQEENRLAPESPLFIIDIDHDGKEEFIEPGPDPEPAPGVCLGDSVGFIKLRDCTLLPRPWVVRRIDGSTITREELPGLNARHGSLGDFDGDGNLDVLAIGPNTSKFMLHRGTGRVNGLLKTVTDGLGRRVDVKYDNKDAEGELVFDSGLGDRTEASPIDPSCRWPYRCAERIQNVVVSSHIESHYLNSSFRANPDPDAPERKVDRQVSYSYKGSRTDIAGNGWLGFWERRVSQLDGAGTPMGQTVITYQPPAPWDPQTSTIPFVHATAGLVASTVETSASDGSFFSSQVESLVVSTSFDWQEGISTVGRPFPKLRGRTVSARGVRSGAEGSELLYSHAEVNEYDDFGNLRVARIDSDDRAAGEALVPSSETTFHISRTFDPEVSTWLISLPKSQTVSAQPRCWPGQDCPSLARQRHTTIDYYDDTTLPRFIRREPSQSEYLLETELVRGDGLGNVTSAISTDASGNRREVQVSYDSRGLFPIAVTRIGDDGISHTTQVRYDDRFGTISTQADPSGIDATFSYDEFGIQRLYRGPDGERSTNYVATDRFVTSDVVSSGLDIISAYRVTVAQSGGSSTEIDYNPLGQIVRRASAGFEGARVLEEFVYDGRQRLQQQTRPHSAGDSSQSLITYQYDNRDRLQLVTFPDGGFVRHEYGIARFANAFGTSTWAEVPHGIFAQRTTVGTGTGDALPRTVELSDRDGRTARLIDPLGKNTDYQYGAFGELERITDPAGRTIEMIHDDWSRVTFTTDAARGGTESASYNGFDEVVHTIDAGLRERSFFYDAFGRLERIEDGDGDTQWIYDGDGTRPNELGRLVETISPSGQRTTLRYMLPESDRNRGLLRQVSEHRVVPGDPASARDFVTDYAFDAFSRLEQVDYPVAFGARPAVKYTYDDFGHVIRASDGNDSSKVHWRFVAADQGYRVGQERVGDADCDSGVEGTLTERIYDELSGRLEGITTTCDEETLQDLTYGYDLAGRMTLRTDAVASRTESFRYDALSRLTHINDVLHYAYDPEGRGRLTSLRSESGVKAYAYQSQGRDWIDTAGPYAYTQDSVGNVETRTVGSSTQTFDYTAFDLPNRITAGASVTDFAYDAAGGRAIKKAASVTTFYGGDHFQEVEGPGGALRTRAQVFVGGRAVAQLDSNSTGSVTRYLYDDALGTVQATALENGSVDGTRDYQPFGEPRASSSGTGTVPNGFTGHEHDDELGLINMRGRLYDAAIGQFLQADPVITEPFSQGLNRFAYVGNSPLNFTDPTGLARHDCALNFSSCGWMGLPSTGVSGTAGTVLDGIWYTSMAVGTGVAGYFASNVGGGIAGVAAPGSKNGHGGFGPAKTVLDLVNIGMSIDAMSGGTTRTTNLNASGPGASGAPAQGAPSGGGHPSSIAPVQEGAGKLDTPLPRGPDARPRLAVEIPGTPFDVDPGLDPGRPSITWNQSIGNDLTPEGRPEIKVGNAPNSPPGKMPPPAPESSTRAGGDLEAKVSKALLKGLHRNTVRLQTQQGQQLLRGLQKEGSWVPYVAIGSAVLVAGGTGYLIYRACDDGTDCSIEWLK